ncbi:MAG: hypothetical protein V3S14_05200 [Anaerolineae bacterium]
MNARNSRISRTIWWAVSLLLLGVAGGLHWSLGQPAYAEWDVTPMPEEGATCGNFQDSPPVVQSLALGNPAAFNPLAGMSLDQIKGTTQTLTPEAAQMLNSLDIQFHNLYPGMALNGATAETLVSIQTSLCIEGMWVQIIMPAQSTGQAKFAYALKSPSSTLDRLHDWVRFPFPAISGTATAGVGLDGFAEGVYPFTWVIGYGNTALMTQDGFLAVGACYSEGTFAPNESPPAFSSPILQSFPPEDSMSRNPLANTSLDQIKEATQALTPEAEQMLNSLDIQFHNLYPGTTLDGPTAVTFVTIQSSTCIQDMWVQIIMPAQSAGQAKFSYALKSPSSVWDRLHDWVRFPFPAVNGTATAGVGLDGFAEGVYPFTWVIGYGDTVLMTQDGIFSVGACCCGGALDPKAPSTATNPLDGMSLDQIKEAAQTLAPAAEQMLNSLDIQFHNSYPSMALNGPTAVTSVTIQSSLCVQDMWAQIIMPAQSTGQAKLAYAFKSPSSVWDRLHDWVRFPFPAINGTATAGVGLDGFAEGVYPFTWVIGHGDTVLMTQDGFLAVSACCCGVPVTPTPPSPSPTPMPAVGDCIQHSPERVDVLMGTGQTIYREIEFANTCDAAFVLDLRFSNLSSQIYLASGHDQIALSPNERQAVRLYFSTGVTVTSDNTELVATSGGSEVARVPVSIGPGAVIQPSPSLSQLNNVYLLPSAVGVFSGTIQNNSSVPLVITGAIPAAASPWLSAADSNPAVDVSVLWRQPRWELGPGDEGSIYFVLHSSEEFTTTASFYLESQYGDRQEIPVSARFGPYADLEISGPTLPMAMVPGDVVTAAITVTNSGPSDAPTVTVPIAVRGDATVTVVTASSGVTCTQETAMVCKVSKLLVGESVTVVIRLEAANVQQTSGSKLSPMGATLRGETLTNLYDPNTPNNVWTTIWGGSHIYLPLVIRN